MMEPIRLASTITSTQTTLVPLWYCESSGTRIASTNVQIQNASAPIQQRPEEEDEQRRAEEIPPSIGR